MSNRICIISYCDKCPYFNNEYYGYEETCTKLKRKISRNKGPFDISEPNGHYDIPDDCPLMHEVAQKESSSGFTTYDTRGGHCGLCGSLFCIGNCFK